MTATFNPSLTDAISRVRQTIGDTVVSPATKAQVQDETITAVLTSKNSDELAASIQLAWDLSARWALAVDTEIDNQLIKASQRAKAYKDLALRLERQAAKGSATANGASFSGIYVGGTTDTRGPNLGLPSDYTPEDQV